jgi:hypothetical protein
MKYDIWMQICDFIVKHDIKAKIQVQCIFEEFLLHSLYALYTKTVPAALCRIFWKCPNYTPTRDLIETCQLPCVKRIGRTLSDPLRVWIRQRLGAQ